MVEDPGTHVAIRPDADRNRLSTSAGSPTDIGEHLPTFPECALPPPCAPAGLNGGGPFHHVTCARVHGGRNRGRGEPALFSGECLGDLARRHACIQSSQEEGPGLLRHATRVGLVSRIRKDRAHQQAAYVSRGLLRRRRLSPADEEQRAEKNGSHASTSSRAARDRMAGRNAGRRPARTAPRVTGRRV
jgi:hypothetical protein